MKLEAPGEITHLGWAHFWRPALSKYKVEWSYVAEDGKEYALGHEGNIKDMEHITPEELEQELIALINNLCREKRLGFQ